MTAKSVERKVQLPQTSREVPEAPALTLEKLNETLVQLVQAHNEHDDQIREALRGGMTSANNGLVRHHTLELQMPPDAPYRALTLKSPWTGSAQILMEPSGRVDLRGFITDGGGGMGNAFTNDVMHGYTSPLKIGLANGLTLVVNPLQQNLKVEDPLATGATQVYLAATWHAILPVAPHAFAAPWPIIVRHQLPKPCLNLDVVAVFEETQGPRSSFALPTPDWADRGDGTIQLNALWGLAWSRKYKVRLRLSAEE